MKNLRYTFIIIATTLFVSCEKALDINQDPNAPGEAPIDLVLPAAQAAGTIHIGGELYNLGGFWAQYYTQSPDAAQYENIDSWNVQSDFFDQTWTEFYAGSLRDLRYVREEAIASGNNSYYLIATCMEAYLYQVLVDLYSQVPYTEAVMGADNLEPGYTDGREIYGSLIDNINEALVMYNGDPEAGIQPTANSDIIFGGNMDNWVQFANTLKLKIFMRASGTSFSDGTEILNLVNGGNLLNVNAAMTQFEAVPNKRNPFYDVNISSNGLGGINHAASQTMVSYLDTNDDARLEVLYERGESGEFLTKPQGDFQDRDISYQDLAKPVFSPTMPIYLFSIPEVRFLQAEALERFAGGAGAQSYYEEGIEASFDMHGLEDTAMTYYGPGGAYAYNTAGTQEDRIRQIMTQKWVAMTSIQNLEAFFEINRTGYPEYETLNDAEPGDLVYSQASVLPQGQTPKRLLFPDISRSRNSNVPPQPAGGLAAPVWWDN